MLHRGSTVSRRNAVTLVAGLAATAAPALAGATTSVLPAERVRDTVALLAQSHRQLLDLLHDVRRAPGAASRGAAFTRVAAAVRTHDVLQASANATRRGRRMPAATQRVTGLYRQAEPDALLAEVIVRELEERSPADAAWMSRFTDLEALIHARELPA